MGICDLFILDVFIVACLPVTNRVTVGQLVCCPCSGHTEWLAFVMLFSYTLNVCFYHYVKLLFNIFYDHTMQSGHYHIAQTLFIANTTITTFSCRQGLVGAATMNLSQGAAGFHPKHPSQRSGAGAPKNKTHTNTETCQQHTGQPQKGPIPMIQAQDLITVMQHCMSGKEDKKEQCHSFGDYPYFIIFIGLSAVLLFITMD